MFVYIYVGVCKFYIYDIYVYFMFVLFIMYSIYRYCCVLTWTIMKIVLRLRICINLVKYVVLKHVYLGNFNIMGIYFSHLCGKQNTNIKDEARI